MFSKIISLSLSDRRLRPFKCYSDVFLAVDQYFSKLFPFAPEKLRAVRVVFRKTLIRRQKKFQFNILLRIGGSLSAVDPNE